MADFSLSQIGDVAPSGPRPQPGVADPSPVTAVSQFISGNIGSLFQGIQESQEREQEAFTNQAISRFSQQQIQIADAVDRGDLTSQEARMRMRANYSSAIADNPGLVGAFSKAHSDIISTAGLGKVAAEGTEQEQAFFKAQDAATQAGWVTPQMSQEQATEATYAYTQFQREQERIDAEQNVLALRRAEVGLQADRINLTTSQINQQSAAIRLQEQRQQRVSRTAAGSMADSYTTRLRLRSQTLLQEVEAGNIAPEEAVSILDDEWMQVQSTVAQTGRDAGGEYVSNLVGPMRDFYQLTRGRLTGEVDAAVYESLSENAIARQAVNITGDPETARILATSRLVGQAGNLALTGPLTEVAIGAVSRNSDERQRPSDLTDPSTEEGSRQYLQILRDSVSRANTGGFIGDREGAEDEVRVNINQVLRGLGTYGSMVDNPQQLNNVVEFLTSDDYGEYVESHGTRINQENASSAREVIQVQFDEVVRPLISEEWRNATESLVPALGGALGGTSAVGEEPTPSVIRPFFTGTGVRFVRGQSETSIPLDGKLRDLNRRVAPVLNRLIRLGAHLEGHRDYQRVYESNYAQLFGDAGTGVSEANE